MPAFAENPSGQPVNPFTQRSDGHVHWNETDVEPRANIPVAGFQKSAFNKQASVTRKH
jgi:hypothetical protein